MNNFTHIIHPSMILLFYAAFIQKQARGNSLFLDLKSRKSIYISIIFISYSKFLGIQINLGTVFNSSIFYVYTELFKYNQSRVMISPLNLMCAFQIIYINGDFLKSITLRIEYSSLQLLYETLESASVLFNRLKCLRAILYEHNSRIMSKCRSRGISSKMKSNKVYMFRIVNVFQFWYKFHILFVFFIQFQKFKVIQMKLGSRGNKYMTISKQKRLQIISLVFEQRTTVKRAAIMTGIGVSTARMIVKKFQRNRTVYEPKKIATKGAKVQKAEILSENTENKQILKNDEVFDNGNKVSSTQYMCYYIFPVQDFTHTFYLP